MEIWIQIQPIFNAFEYWHTSNPNFIFWFLFCAQQPKLMVNKTNKYATYCMYLFNKCSDMDVILICHCPNYGDSLMSHLYPMTQIIAYDSCVMRDFNTVSLIFENFTHFRLGSGADRVSKHQENNAKSTLTRLQPLKLSLIFVFASWYIDLLYVPPYCKYLVGAIRVRI